MSKNPKIEFFKLDLKPTNPKKTITFRTLFQEIYRTENPENSNVKRNIFKDNDVMSGFYKYLYKKIDETYNDNPAIKKAFSAKTIRVENVKKPSITMDRESHIVEGIITGGYYDTGKELGSITSAKNGTEKLPRDKILLDDFYFMLYTPLNKSTGILILQSYTRDSVGDIFKPFIQNLFSFKSLTFNAVITEFMPKEMQEMFKENSVIKEFSFSQKVIGKSVKDPIFHNNDFNIKVEIRPEGNIKLSKLDAFKAHIEKFSLSFFGKDPKELTLENFNDKKAYLKPDDTLATETPFQLDGNIDIKATVFLKNYIRVDDIGIPDFEELKIYARKLLLETVIKDVFPEMNLK